jgi:hypothetical protein
VARVAVLGSAPLLDACAPASVAGLEVIEVPAEGDVAGVGSLGVDAIVAFDPDEALAARLDGPALLWSSVPGRIAPGPGQRLVLSSGDHPAAWRCVSLPVADRHYTGAEAELSQGAAWLGRPTRRRSSYLSWFTHTDAPAEDGTEALVAVNMHDSDEPTFEPRVARALARGQLLVSETLAPTRGLEPGIDFLEAQDLDDLYLAVESATLEPHAFRRVRLRGRRKAELFRSSAVIPRLVDDLLLELGRSASA